MAIGLIKFLIYEKTMSHIPLDTIFFQNQL